MLKRKKALLIALCALLTLLVGAAAVFLLMPKKAVREEAYNRNPELSGKKLSGYLATADFRIPTDMEGLTRYANVILIGTVLEDGLTDEFDLYGEESPLSRKVQSLGYSSKFSCTYAEIKVEEILAGEAPPEDTFLLFQLGEGEEGQPKVHAGERVILILETYQETYKCLDGATSVFYLDENDRLTSLSPLMACARYDGLSLNSFECDLQNSFYYSVIGGTEEQWRARGEKYRADTAFHEMRQQEWDDLTGGKPKDYEYAIAEDFCSW